MAELCLIIKVFFSLRSDAQNSHSYFIGKNHILTPHLQGTRMNNYTIFFEAVISKILENSTKIIFSIREAEAVGLP